MMKTNFSCMLDKSISHKYKTYNHGKLIVNFLRYKEPFSEHNLRSKSVSYMKSSVCVCVGENGDTRPEL